MKNRDMIEAFEAALGDLPVPDQEERRQLFIEKLEELDRARTDPDSGGPQPPDRGAGSGRRPAQSQPAPRKPAFPMIIVIALAIAAVLEAVTIGVLLIYGGKKTDTESPSSPPVEVVTSPGTDSQPGEESPSAPGSSGTPAQQPSPSPSAASPSASVSGSAGPQDTGEPPAQSGGEESADPGAVPSYETGDDTGTEDGSAPSDSAGTAPEDGTGTGDGAAPSDSTGTAPADGTGNNP